VADNPRIDDLRRRLEKEPNSRLFAQLAEELRKDGEFEEAIRIARAGLARHPNYPSARMTLGRALFDTGDMAAARHELQSVLEGAPDNILASRLLAECLESLGDLEGALQRFRATLALSPGDKQITARVRDLEGKLHASPARAAPDSPAASGAPPESARPEPAPIPLATVDEPMELEVSHERAAPPAAPAAAVPVAEAPAEFELEKAYEAPGTAWKTDAGGEAAGAAPASAAPESAAVAPEPPPEPVPAGFEAAPPVPIEPLPYTGGEATVAVSPASPESAGEQTLIDEAATVLAPPAPAPAADREPVAAAAPPPAVEAPAPPVEPSFEYTFEPPRPAVPLPPPAPVTPPAPEAPPPAVAAPAPGGAAAARPATEELLSPTLAELYLNQGFPDKAIEVYRRLLEREPGNERARTRLGELERAPAAATPAPVEAPPPAAAPRGEADAAREARRKALERTIDRLESLRAALQRGAR
jgi:tetratricopeptide (TPR) repeat protein